MFSSDDEVLEEVEAHLYRTSRPELATWLRSYALRSRMDHRMDVVTAAIGVRSSQGLGGMIAALERLSGAVDNMLARDVEMRATAAKQRTA